MSWSWFNRSPFKKPHWERQMHAEFKAHIEHEIDDLVEKGMTREDAVRRARRDFGAIELAKDECRDQRAFEPVQDLLRDLRQAVRSLRKAPAYATTAILTLALGIGANTAIFSALDGVVLKPLPYREPDRLATVALYNRGLKHTTYLAYLDFIDWQRNARSFEQMAAFAKAGFDLTNRGTPEHVNGYEISSGFFDTLGVSLAMGRSFSPAEDKIGGMPAAVISNRLWRERFGGDRAILRKPITLNGAGYTVVGVLSPAFRFEEQTADVYTPLGRGNPLFLKDRTVHNILCVARLGRGVSLSQAQAEMNTLQEHINELNPTTEKGQSTSIISLKQEMVGDVGGTLLLLLGAVGLVLLIACANVANLSLARSAAGTREFAVRRALGASRTQIVRQLIVESVLLSTAGGVLGLLFAKFGLRVVLSTVPGGLPRTENVGVNLSVLTFALAVSVAAGILFGLLPALRHANADLQTGLREAGRGSTGGHRHTQKILAIAQIALALVLLSGAGLLLRTVRNLWAAYPGYDTRHVITCQVGLSPTVTRSASSTRAAYRQLTDRIREIPGVASADLTALTPLGGGDNSGPFWIGSHQPASMAEIPRATYYPIGPDYPQTMQIRLLRGRLLTRGDDIHSERVALIDDEMEHMYFRDRDPVGQSLTIPHWGQAGAVSARIVGVVGHVQQYGMDGSRGDKPQIYYSFYQLPDEGLPVFRGEVTFALRTPLNVAAILPAMKEAVRGMSGDQPIFNIRTMTELVSGSMAHQRFATILLVAFALVALLLAAVGIYGVISYSTAQRVPEIGIRMALGAERRDVLGMLMGEGLRLAFAGIAIGLGMSFIFTRTLTSFSRLLYGVSATDPLTLVAVSLGLTIAALLACFIPARRAAGLDPATALRND